MSKVRTKRAPKLKVSPSLKLFSVGVIPVYSTEDIIYFTTNLAIDFDGAPNAYHPPTAAHPNTGRPPGLDYLANAGKTGNWYGIVTDTGKRNGKPVIQGELDPYPGYYVSSTALCDHTKKESDPRRFVDATKIPYFVLPGGTDFPGVALGDMAMVFYKGHTSSAIYADVGPKGEIGEGSLALSFALELGASGHEADDITYVIFPGSRAQPAWPRGLDEMHVATSALFSAWGGAVKLHGLGILP